MYRELVPQLVDVGDDQDPAKVVLDRVDRLNQPLAALGVLSAEALVDDQHLELGAGTPGQQLAEGDADRKVDPERLAAAKQG